MRSFDYCLLMIYLFSHEGQKIVAIQIPPYVNSTNTNFGKATDSFFPVIKID